MCILYIYIYQQRGRTAARGLMAVSFFFSCPWADRRRVRSLPYMVFADRAHTQHTRAAHPRNLPNLLLQSSSTKWTAPKQTVFLGESQPTALGREHTRSAPELNLFFLHAFCFLRAHSATPGPSACPCSWRSPRDDRAL